MSDETIDLSKLSETELHILRLFAQGHTAKSVATETERTVGAVNERLREARRKTGIASSRELARILAAQENRDEKIDLDQRDEDDPDDTQAIAGTRRLWLAGGIFIMIAITFVGSVLATTMLTQSAPSSVTDATPDDPMLGTWASRMSPGDKYRLVRTEQRDAAWADPAERTITAEYKRILQSRGVRDETLRVHCAATLCEVALRAAISNTQAQSLTEDFQTHTFYDKLAAKGYIGQTAGFGGDGPAKAPIYVHFSYWAKRGSENEKRPR